jgi:hypothetical protein
MTFLFLMLCALCEVFLLRFLLALVRENRSALRHRDYYRGQSKQTVTSGALLQMKSQTGGEQVRPWLRTRSTENPGQDEPSILANS